MRQSQNLSLSSTRFIPAMQQACTHVMHAAQHPRMQAWQEGVHTHRLVPRCSHPAGTGGSPQRTHPAAAPALEAGLQWAGPGPPAARAPTPLPPRAPAVVAGAAQAAAVAIARLPQAARVAAGWGRARLQRGVRCASAGTYITTAHNLQHQQAHVQRCKRNHQVAGPAAWAGDPLHSSPLLLRQAHQQRWVLPSRHTPRVSISTVAKNSQDR